MAKLLSDRLFALLRREVARLEVEARERIPASAEHSPGGSGGDLLDKAGGKPAPAGAKAASPRTGFKERADALILLTRTLEKLLELREVEARAGKDDESETLRLRDEFMAQLRALDARRAGGPRLFADAADKTAKPTGSKPARRRTKPASLTVADGRGANGGS